jgi:hypothetical protein
MRTKTQNRLRLTSRCAGWCLAVSLVASVLSSTACATSRSFTPTSFAPTVREGLRLQTPVNLAVFDARTERANDIAKIIEAGIARAYGANVRMVSYHEPLQAGVVTIKIRINQLHAEFGSRIVSMMALQQSWSAASAAATDGWNVVAGSAASYSETLGTGFVAEGWWVGTSQLDFEVQDFRGSRPIGFNIPIVGERNESNTWGYRTASSVSRKAWSVTESQMMRLLDAVVQKLMNER